MTAPAAARTHVDGLLALLLANLPSAPAPPGQPLQVYSGGAVAGAVAPYIVLYPDPGFPDGTLGDRFRWLTLGFQVKAVGTSVRQAQWAGDWARGVLLTLVPAVTGRVVYPLWQDEGSPPVTRDDDVSPPVYYDDRFYTLKSAPA